VADVQTADPGRKIQNRYRITGPPPIFTVNEEIQPVVLMDSLAGPIQVSVSGVGGFDPLDALFERPCAGFRNQTAGGGDAPIVRIINPVNSNILAIFEDFLPITSADTTVAVRLNLGANFLIAATAGIQFRDARLSGTPACGFNNESSVPTLDLDWQIPVFLSTRAQIVVPLPYVLRPGDDIEFRSGTINTTLGISLHWRERGIIT